MNKQTKWINPTKTKTYYAWRNMRSRCYNPNNASYYRYGGRGIRVCPQWKDNYDQFCADMGEAPENMSIDRIDNEGNYEPNNCQWATTKQQNNNTRVNRRITYNGKTQTLTQWAEQLKIRVDTLYRRLAIYKMPTERALVPENLKPTWEHGTRQGYEGHHCRCDACRQSNNARHRQRRANRKQQIAACAAECAGI